MVGVPIGNDEYVLERAGEIVKEGGTDHLARCLANMLDKQAAALIVTQSLGQRTGYREWALDTELSREACRRADNGRQWAYEKIHELPGAAEEQSFFEEGRPDDRLTLQPISRLKHACLPEWEGSGCLRRKRGECPPLLGARWGSYPEVLADLTGPLGDRVRRGLPESRIIAQLGGSLREIRDQSGVTKEEMASIVPESWLEWGLGTEGDAPPRSPVVDILAAHDGLPLFCGKPNMSWVSW